MQLRTLGNSDLKITPLGVGAWAMGGGDWAFGWGSQDDEASVAAVHAALDEGWNWIDTAAVYGLGHAEIVVGKAVKERTAKPYVFTKCARVWDENRQIGKRLKSASVKKECEDSLRRLAMETIDLYQIHWPEPDEDIAEAWQTLAELKAEGKIRWAGVSNFSRSQLERIAPISPITSLQPPYSLVTPEIEAELLPYCAANNIGTLVYSPMKSGLLSGAMTRERIAAMPANDFRQRTPNFQEPLLTQNLALVERLRAIGARHGRTPGEVAIAWTLRRPEVTAAIVGLRSPAQLEGVKGAATFRLSAEELVEVESA